MVRAWAAVHWAATVHWTWTAAAAMIAVTIMVIMAMVVQQAGNRYAQHATGNTTYDRTLGAAHLATDNCTTRRAEDAADQVVGHGGSAAQAHGKYQGGKNTHFIHS